MYKGQPAPAGEVNKPLLIAKTLLLTILLFFGAFGFFFFIWKDNPNASGSCLMLEILCAMYLHFNTAVLKGTLEQKFNRTRLKIVFILTIVIGVIQFLGALSYIVLATTQKQKFQVEGRSFYVASIPAAFAALIAPFLAYESKVAMALFPEVNTGVVGFPA
ncbi:hypothetical protein JTE90_006918 [Oedothorax gibbosus]|uniref:Uncharacterized protein n=1 Tax=Oedothorax gibbosus TaxID=931172 RepID=A0AAV6VQY8_9ARAC|nr:hypothetical protein JTE90_006918 [Oedothorax gibbosus]